MPRPPSAAPFRAARSVWAVVAFAACAALAPAGVQLITPEGVYYGWDLADQSAPNVQGGKVSFYLDPGGPARFVQEAKSHVDARLDGIRSWEVTTSGLRFVEDPGRPAAGRDSGDRINWIGFDDQGLGAFTFAVTYPTQSGDAMIDADIVLNDGDFTWATRTGRGETGEADIESIIVHEWGHAIGLDHVPLRGSPMYFASERGQISGRRLSDDDEATVGGIYPNLAFEEKRGAIRGRVTHFSPQDNRAIHVVAVSVATLEPAASTLTAPDGSYRIPGLPQGGYRLLATPTVPLSPAMNRYWYEGVTTFIPAWLREDDGNPAPLAIVSVAAGSVTEAPDFTVREVSNPLEDNDSAATATPIGIGDGVCARLESGLDVDVYKFEGEAGQVLTAVVHADRIGSAVDPALSLLRLSGLPVASSVDIRDPTLYGRTIEGPDLDARILAVTLPASDTYLLRVSRQNAGDALHAFYALSLTTASDAPSSALTTVDAEPGRIDAGGGAQTTIVVRPKRENGADLKPPTTVELEGDGLGTLDEVYYDVIRGQFAATLTAADTPSAESFDVTVTTPQDGAVSLLDVLRVVYLGPIDAQASSLVTVPRRIDADGLAQATVVFRPIDARNEPLGKGRTPTFAFAFAFGDATDATFGPATDQFDGTYAVSVSAATERGAAVVQAGIAGQVGGPTVTVHFGFPLDEVLDQARTDVAGAIDLPAVKRKARSPLKGALRKIEQAVADAALGPASPREKAALQRTKQAVFKLVSALKKGKGTVPDPGTAGELARAIRDAAQDAIDRAVIDSTKDEKRQADAIRLLAEGAEMFSAGNAKGATKRWLKAFGRVRKLAGS